MNIDELRMALASNATRKADSLEKQVKRMRSELRDKDKTIESQNETLRIMFNRCMVYTRGMLCIFCGEREKCDEIRSAGRDKNTEMEAEP